ncbi:hypothetical protein L4C34_17300 [Vibrio profundum]|uniref:hypothetical protein n=1 Tax=Vibrio profundum TaxID=2910247 RepID=UPI003D12D1AE
MTILVKQLFGLLLFLVASLSLAGGYSCETENKVSVVYPSGSVLPENLLRFYIYFDQPMHREGVLSSVYLAKTDGSRLSGVFLENKFNLWSEDGRRLTLIFNPGRVKQGLNAHRTFGRALTGGDNYQLVVESKTKDLRGCHLAETYRKHFLVSKADHEKPDIRSWKQNQIQKYTKDVLKVTLNGSQDHVSLAYGLRVKRSDGTIVAGRIGLSEHEAEWQFFPDNAWRDEDYYLAIQPNFEDLAGNRTSNLFDQPLKSKTETAPVLSCAINFYESNKALSSIPAEFALRCPHKML